MSVQAEDAAEFIVDAADYITEMRCIRHPFEKGIPARKGVSSEVGVGRIKSCRTSSFRLYSLSVRDFVREERSRKQNPGCTGHSDEPEGGIWDR